MKKFSGAWKSSGKPRKQRKYRLNAPLHIKQKLVHSHLSKDLRKKYSMRSVSLRKGDKVKIMRGNFKKQEGKVDSISTKDTAVFVSGIEVTKKDGTKRLVLFNPSNLMITELNLDDKQRQEILERK
ncbi:50S ribosomal protein L24 [Candidatus Woesearchaeota archaeon]|nr:50S ribosomal protein L24 [Candidatus Woesearchaeota archaeon]